MSYTWDWLVFFRPAYSGGGIYLDWLVSGLKWTLLVSLGAWVIAFVLGSLLGVARTMPYAPLRALAAAYVEVVRNVPLLVQMFLWFFVVPELVPQAWGDWLKTGMPMPEATLVFKAVGGSGGQVYTSISSTYHPSTPAQPSLPNRKRISMDSPPLTYGLRSISEVPHSPPAPLQAACPASGLVLPELCSVML